MCNVLLLQYSIIMYCHAIAHVADSFSFDQWGESWPGLGPGEITLVCV